jgi:hypothetical protein
LPVITLKKQLPSRGEVLDSGGNQAPDQIKPIVTATIQRQDGFFPDLGVRLFNPGRSEVRGIGYDDVKDAVNVGKQIALDKRIWNIAKPLRVFVCDGKRVGTDVGQRDGTMKFPGERDADTTASRAHIQEPEGWGRSGDAENRLH